MKMILASSILLAAFAVHAEDDVYNGQFIFDHAVKANGTTTLFNPQLDMGNNKVADILYQSADTAAGACIAYGYTGGNVGESIPAQDGALIVVLDNNGSVSSISQATCNTSVCDQVISVITCQDR